MNREFALIACLCLSVACAGERTRQTASEAPHLRVQGEAIQLIVDGRPFLMLAGELGNSTASDLGYLREYWPRLQALRLNTVLAPLILEHQGKGTIAGVRPVVAFDGTVEESPQEVRLGELTLHVRFVDPWTPREQQTIAALGGLVIQLGPEEYLIAGRGLTVTFSAGEGIVGIERIQEGAFENGNWVPAGC